MIVARAFGFGRREFFDAPAAAELAPEVRYSAIAQAGGGAGRRAGGENDPRLAALAAVCAAAVLAAAPAAHAESADVVDADVHLGLADDASLLVTERLTFDYNGTFEGSYRDINLLHGEKITDIRVSERGTPTSRAATRRSAATTAPGSSAPSRAGRRRPDRVALRRRRRGTHLHDLLSRDRRRGRLRRRHRRRLGRMGRPVGLRPRPSCGAVHGPAPGPRRPALPRLGPIPSAVDGETERATASRRSKPPTSPTTPASKCASRFRAAGHERQRRAGQVGEGLPQILAEEQQLDDDFNAPWPSFKRWVADNAVLLSLGSRRSRGCSRC